MAGLFKFTLKLHTNAKIFHTDQCEFHFIQNLKIYGEKYDGYDEIYRYIDVVLRKLLIISFDTDTLLFTRYSVYPCQARVNITLLLPGTHVRFDVSRFNEQDSKCWQSKNKSSPISFAYEKM